MSEDKFSKEKVMEMIRHLRDVCNFAWFNESEYSDECVYEVKAEDFDKLVEMVRQYDEEV